MFRLVHDLQKPRPLFSNLDWSTQIWPQEKLPHQKHDRIQFFKPNIYFTFVSLWCQKQAMIWTTDAAMSLLGFKCGGNEIWRINVTVLLEICWIWELSVNVAVIYKRVTIRMHGVTTPVYSFCYYIHIFSLRLLHLKYFHKQRKRGKGGGGVAEEGPQMQNLNKIIPVSLTMREDTAYGSPGFNYLQDHQDLRKKYFPIKCVICFSVQCFFRNIFGSEKYLVSCARDTGRKTCRPWRKVSVIFVRFQTKLEFVVKC
jgi:hypothetical protein